MYQNLPYYQYNPNNCYQPQMVQQPQMGLRGRPVTSFEEARAAQIDLDGSVALFPDLANNKIYTKQINMDGTATLKVFSLVQTPEPATQEYVTREEFAKVINQLRGVHSNPKPTTNF